MQSLLFVIGQERAEAGAVIAPRNFIGLTPDFLQNKQVGLRTTRKCTGTSVTRSSTQPSSKGGCGESATFACQTLNSQPSIASIDIANSEGRPEHVANSCRSRRSTPVTANRLPHAYQDVPPRIARGSATGLNPGLLSGNSRFFVTFRSGGGAGPGAVAFLSRASLRLGCRAESTRAARRCRKP